MLARLIQDPGTAEPYDVLEGLPPHQKWVAIAIASIMLIVVIELVRKRKLREEYSVLWTLTAVVLLLLALQPPLLNIFKHAIGAVEPIPALLFGGIVFLMALSLQFSIRLSRITLRNRTLSQRLALLEREILELREQAGLADEPKPAEDEQTDAD